MITIIHGDDTKASRNYFLELHNDYKPETVFNGEKVSITEITEVFEGNGLFASNVPLFLEDFLAKRKPSKEYDQIVKEITKKTDKVIVLWEGKELTKAKLGIFKKAVIEHFKLPQHMFEFLDSLIPGNNTKLIQLFHKNLTTTPEEMLLFMMVRQFRLLLGMQESSIEEVSRMAPWQKSKLNKQFCQFSVKHLTKLYHTLYTIDKKAKTGTLSMPLIVTLDIFLLEI